MFSIDDTEFIFAHYDVSTSDKIKDYEMQNGDIIRYVNRKSIVSLSCTVFLSKSELATLKNILSENTEHTVKYRHNSIQTAYMFAENVSYKKIGFAGDEEYWEASFTLKECRR